jgi:DNA-binding LacI/PurR family transcriptional regulator
MPVSIKDIARLAGVSHSTVSRALHQSPLIPPETARRIQRIAQEQGYTASAVARSLVTRRTQAIGVVVTSIADPFNGDLVDGIEEVANERGYSVILATSQANPDRELAVVRSCQERRVDGILVASSRVGALYVPILSDLDVPIVLINNQHGSDFAHSIRIDNIHGMRLATEHLLELGHRQIAYVGDRFGLHSDEERFAGYRQALTSREIPFDRELVMQGDGKADAAASALDQLLKGRSRPTAVACYNDMTALGLIHRAQEHGIAVPDELSVTGFDDIPFAAFARPPLTTIRQPRRDMGRQAMRLLFALLNGEEAQKTSVINGELIVRGSTAPLPR